MSGGAVPLELEKRSGFPYFGTSFVGRRSEAAGLREALERHRLVTVTGVGGCGKTRLAVETALDDGERISATIFVDFASVSDGTLIWNVLAEAAGIRSGSTTSVPNAVIDALRLRSSTLLLDNCEHLVEPIASLSELVLRNCPEARILATSRQPLGVSGEALFPLAPLPTPGQQHTASEVESNPSVRLLYERARLRNPRLRPTAANVQHAIALCNALEGIPLAIEVGRLGTRVHV